jgi:hypothetical protein
MESKNLKATNISADSITGAGDAMSTFAVGMRHIQSSRYLLAIPAAQGCREIRWQQLCTYAATCDSVSTLNHIADQEFIHTSGCL